MPTFSGTSLFTPFLFSFTFLSASSSFSRKLDSCFQFRAGPPKGSRVRFLCFLYFVLCVTSKLWYQRSSSFFLIFFYWTAFHSLIFLPQSRRCLCILWINFFLCRGISLCSKRLSISCFRKFWAIGIFGKININFLISIS